MVNVCVYHVCHATVHRSRISKVLHVPVTVEDDESRDDEGYGYQVGYDGVSETTHVDL